MVSVLLLGVWLQCFPMKASEVRRSISPAAAGSAGVAAAPASVTAAAASGPATENYSSAW